MTTLRAAIDTLTLFGNPTRVRLLRLLTSEELSVADLVRITRLAQPRVSTHLARLREAGLLRAKRVGASTLYASRLPEARADLTRVWAALSSGVRDPLLDGDRERCEALLRARRTGDGFPDALAGHMERYYSPGRTWESLARGLLGLLELGDVIDLGSGDGAVAELLAPQAASITCVDKSARMLAAARGRLGHAPGARFVEGDLADLPLADARFDTALLFASLLYVEAPQRAVAEAARVLRAGGRVAVVALLPHDHAEVAKAYGHAHLGLKPATLKSWLQKAGLDVVTCERTSRERRPPYFEVLTAFAKKPASGGPRRAKPARAAPPAPQTPKASKGSKPRP